MRIKLRQGISSPLKGWCADVGGIPFRRTSALYPPTYANALKSVTELVRRRFSKKGQTVEAIKGSIPGRNGQKTFWSAARYSSIASAKEGSARRLCSMPE